MTTIEYASLDSHARVAVLLAGAGERVRVVDNEGCAVAYVVSFAEWEQIQARVSS